MDDHRGRRGQGPESHVKNLVDVAYDGTHTLKRYAGRPADFTLWKGEVRP